MEHAKAACPELLVLQYNFPLYEEISKTVVYICVGLRSVFDTALDISHIFCLHYTCATNVC